jgi:cyclopropane fatty-acyl-phospholipid synthase-like methyltransferase
MDVRGIWTTKEEIATHEFDGNLCYTISQLFEGDFVDIGCGNGAYTKYLNEHDRHCVGYDGSPLTKEITNGLCDIKDFSVPVNIGKYDNVLCLEVGEHIPLQYEQVFINNLCNATKENIILSWAVVGQGGTGHVNNRDNYYVIGEMQQRGFMLDHSITKSLREGATLSWFKTTLLVFKKQ